MDSDAISPRNSEPTSLTESMQLVEAILNDDKIDRIDKIDKLEAILSAAALLPSDPETSLEPVSNQNCSCNCHSKIYGEGRVLSPTNRYINQNGSAEDVAAKENHHNVETQTLSTGDIVVTKIYFNEATE